jgi:hypothetical protein
VVVGDGVVVVVVGDDVVVVVVGVGVVVVVVGVGVVVVVVGVGVVVVIFEQSEILAKPLKSFKLIAVVTFVIVNFKVSPLNICPLLDIVKLE